MIYTTTSLDYLIDDLRVHLGDIAAPYRYEDAHLRHALVMACKTLARKWGYRYSIDGNYVVARNASLSFEHTSPPVIDQSDERCFILQAAIIVKSATLNDSAWDIASWKDDEVSYSNIAGGKALESSLDRDLAELAALLKRKLMEARTQSLGGFHYPTNEREGYQGG